MQRAIDYLENELDSLEDEIDKIKNSGATTQYAFLGLKG